ncbi:hypothetical protein EWM64_g2925 [Hericium alpestre]|uniref:Uncharacterized protein n=1 Tax=Hericium alpestre TaxID=135208 RepID=A0A4Z0A3S1_9AGAM|nr:hypothetical protein EWM64_g2925 [Hericium alpestre]
MSPSSSPTTLPFKYRRKSLSSSPAPPSPSLSPVRPYPSSSRYAEQYSPYKYDRAPKWSHTFSDDDLEPPGMSDDATSFAAPTESSPSSPSLAPPSPHIHDNDPEDVYVDIVSSSPVRDSAFAVSASAGRSLQCETERYGCKTRYDKVRDARTRVHEMIHSSTSAPAEPILIHDDVAEDAAAALLALHAGPRLTVPAPSQVPPTRASAPAAAPVLTASKSASLHLLLAPLDPPSQTHVMAHTEPVPEAASSKADLRRASDLIDRPVTPVRAAELRHADVDVAGEEDLELPVPPSDDHTGERADAATHVREVVDLESDAGADVACDAAFASPGSGISFVSLDDDLRGGSELPDAALDDDLTFTLPNASSPLSSPPSSPVFLKDELPVISADREVKSSWSSAATKRRPSASVDLDLSRRKKAKIEETDSSLGALTPQRAATPASEDEKPSPVVPPKKRRKKLRAVFTSDDENDAPPAAAPSRRAVPERNPSKSTSKSKAKRKPRVKRAVVEDQQSDSEDGAPLKENTRDELPMELEPPLLGSLIETLAFARASSCAAEVVWREVNAAYPNAFAHQEHSGDDGRALVQEVLDWGVRRGVFGKIKSSGESLPPSYFYLASLDPDRERGALMSALAPRPAKRAETMKYKQYYWRPVRMAVPERRAGPSERKARSRRKDKHDGDGEGKDRMWEVDWEES